MNVNEVISNRAIELQGGDRFQAEKPIHPNDHVNMGQSTNDTFPTAIHVAVAVAIEHRLLPALAPTGGKTWQNKAQEWDRVIKIGRTHLMDATPLRLGQEFGGFARQIELSVRTRRSGSRCRVGTARRRYRRRLRHQYASRIRWNGSARCWPPRLEIPFVEAVNHFEANAQRDGLGRLPRPLANDCHDAVQRGQQHSLAGLRPAVRLSTKSSCPAGSLAAPSCRARSIP